MVKPISKNRASTVIFLREALIGRPVDFVDLLVAADLSEAVIEDPLSSVPLDSVFTLFDGAAKELNDPCFGINISKEMRLGGAGLLSQLALRAPTAGEALRLLVRFTSVFITQMKTDFIVEHGVGKLSWIYPDNVAKSRIQYNMYGAAMITRLLKMALGEDWRPLAVEFDHRSPDCDETALHEVFGPRIRFEQSRNAISVDANALATPMPSADPVMLAVFLDLAKRQVKEIAEEKPSIIDATGREILLHLASGRASLEYISAALGQTPRRLQWRLAQAGTTFEKVLNSTRQDMARYLLVDTNRQVSDISLQLGYGEPSAFTRAAKRWFGMSPREFRQTHREQH
ncbi:MAG: AraC family transcriptional regulator [Hyphomicrobiaceae bacterium]